MKKATMLLSTALAAVLALSPAVPVRAAEKPGGKEEVVYINLLPDGTVDTVEVVNIFQLAQPGTIVDHGGYDSVRNMTSTDPVSFDGQTVTIDAAKAGRLYYEGSLPDAQIPWLFRIHYYIDGREVTAADAAGMSGALRIRLTAAENPGCKGGFFAGCALQISFTLDGSSCRDITADGATVANVGGDKQLTFTVLPGKGADVSVTAQVTDFEMDAVAINGVPLSLDVQVDDEQLLDKVTELTDAITQLDEGAGTLSDGAAELQTGADAAAAGASALYSGASSLYSGAGSLQSGGASVQSGAYSVSTGAAEVDAGAQSLKSGLDTLGEGLSTLSGQSAALTDGSAAILTALTDVQTAVDGAGLTDDQLALVSGTLDSLQSSVDTLREQLALAVSAVEALGVIHDGYVSQAEKLSAAITALDTSADPAVSPLDTTALQAVCDDLQANNESFASTLETLTGLSDTASTLMTDLDALGTALAALSGLVPQLPGALSELKTGVDALVTQYATLDEAIQSYTDGVAAACDGCATLAEGAATLTEGSAALAEGADTLYTGATSLAGGISSLYTASGTLSSGAAALDSGVGDLLAGVTALGEGAGALAEGTGQMAEQTDGMDETIQEQIDGLLSGVNGQWEPESFVSDENDNVQAVQFVIRTPPIEKPAPEEPEPGPETDSSFWEKLIALF